jgi:hypothetical protein
VYDPVQERLESRLPYPIEDNSLKTIPREKQHAEKPYPIQRNVLIIQGNTPALHPFGENGYVDPTDF